MFKKKSDRIFFLVVILAGAIYFYFMRRTPDLPKNEVSFNTTQGVESLSDFAGEPLIVSYYAAWCGHCMNEMPSLVNQKSYFESKGVQVLLLTDDGADKIDLVRQRFGVPYPMYTLDKSIRDYGIYSIPTTYFYNDQGEEVYALSGQIDWNAETTHELIEKHFEFAD